MPPEYPVAASLPSIPVVITEGKPIVLTAG
jgi:hypothetical protein